MKIIKKKYKILISIVVLVLLIPPFNYFVMKDSVMEDIYRSVNRSYYNINKFEGINTLDYEDIEGQLWMGGYVSGDYEKGRLKEDFDITLYFPTKEERDSKNISIVCLVTLDDKMSMRIGMEYEHQTRTMIYETIYLNVDKEEGTILSTQYYDEATITRYLTQYGITQEDIKDYQHYILYDVVYQSWVSGTDNGRKLNKWDYRNIKEVDNTFNFEVVE